MPGHRKAAPSSGNGCILDVVSAVRRAVLIVGRAGAHGRLCNRARHVSNVKDHHAMRSFIVVETGGGISQQCAVDRRKPDTSTGARADSGSSNSQ